MDDSVKKQLKDNFLDLANDRVDELEDIKMSADDAEKRKAVDIVESFLNAVGKGKLGDSVVSSIQKLFTFDKSNIRMITNVDSAGAMTAVDAHANYLDSTLKLVSERLRSAGLYSGEVVSDAGSFERDSIFYPFLQLSVAEAGERALKAFDALHSAKITEESVDVRRSTSDRMLGLNRKAKV